MEITNFRLLEAWDGRDYIVLSQCQGFNFSAQKFSQGIIIGGEYALLFNDAKKINREKLIKILELLNSDDAPNEGEQQ